MLFSPGKQELVLERFWCRALSAVGVGVTTLVGTVGGYIMGDGFADALYPPGSGDTRRYDAR